ncbi:hypothetical protein [Paraburkholderia rhizosphaerae]|uniref:Uncharacterized protein n=1 Tax=Paraburkholderia rhizosphaerae TaxID=480658 RepID=A0A4R8LJA1_9BURK|nr:hypothetical protein [Paraburkholderia rhizosphaerae]TDY43875.1 hypothetical protein BX592_11777 [Paraburkholderia rhizosphaerae]
MSRADKIHTDILRFAFKVELARGASFIASTLSPESTAAAVAEVLESFVVDRGPDGLEDFRTLLIQELKKRRCVNAAQVVDTYSRIRLS